MNNKATKLTLFLLIILAMIEVAVMMLMNAPEPATEKVDTNENAQLVSILPVQLTNTADVVYLPAKVRANVSATLAAEKAGRIMALAADRGDHVGKGQLLLKIDDRILQAALKQAEVAMRDALSNYDRFKKLQKTGAVSASEYDGIERAYIVAEALLDEARVNIELCRIHSPVDGNINDRFVEAGEYVQPGTPVFEVVDSQTVKVLILVPEKDIFALHKGDRVSFSVQPLADRVFTGTVSFIATQADESNNAFRAELTIENRDGVLRPGMIARVEFVRGIRENMISLPLSAVVPSNGDHIVYLVKDGQAVRRKVQVETITRERALIATGLTNADLVITEGNRTLSDGQLVELTGKEASQ
ncbi:MAG: efflux RND transporter periplasmic adaptor subunit [Kiritimatiellales bacterium]|nr:efflux RND transporter periplasmic adaptor subunit [Kiritimatiellales bacterium]